MGGRVIVVGSVNVDLVARVDRLPAPGETVTGARFERHPGGKGGNQATAAARLGARVAFVGAVGDDPLASEAREALAREGVDVSELANVAGATGVALILVDRGGENLIAVAPGANGLVTVDAVEAALDRLGVGLGDVVAVSNEIPTVSVVAALRGARGRGATTVLNPAPAGGLDGSVMPWTDILTPNELELDELVAGMGHRAADPLEAARRLIEAASDGHHAAAVVVTLGARGALLVQDRGAPIEIAVPSVTAVDTVGAGDTLVGTLAADLASGRSLEDATRRAVVAASLSTTRPGARGGMPTLAELDAAIAST